MVYVACGNAYSAAITEDGALYTWGKGSCGRLGHGETFAGGMGCLVRPLEGEWAVW